MSTGMRLWLRALLAVEAMFAVSMAASGILKLLSSEQAVALSLRLTGDLHLARSIVFAVCAIQILIAMLWWPARQWRSYWLSAHCLVVWLTVLEIWTGGGYSCGCFGAVQVSTGVRIAVLMMGGLASSAHIIMTLSPRVAGMGIVASLLVIGLTVVAGPKDGGEGSGRNAINSLGLLRGIVIVTSRSCVHCANALADNSAALEARVGRGVSVVLLEAVSESASTRCYRVPVGCMVKTVDDEVWWDAARYGPGTVWVVESGHASGSATLKDAVGKTREW